MEPGGHTEWLRAAAPRWSLAGDERLLHTLDALHQRVVSGGAACGARLDALAAALDKAALALGNLNNQFSSLSNRQFVERRVYDDDADGPGLAARAPPPAAAAPAPAPAAPTGAGGLEAAAVGAGVRALLRLHEAVAILPDTDSDSDSDAPDARVVLRPLDVYAARPLPHVIGSRAFVAKWHAGLVAEDSDSEGEDSASLGGGQSSRSASGSDLGPEPCAEPRGRRASTASDTSSEAAPPPAAPAPPPATPAAVAAELARRLAHASCAAPESAAPESAAPESAAPSAAPRRLYAPLRPALGALFPDEPPPLPAAAATGGSPPDDDDDDVFAELRRGTPPRGRDAAPGAGDEGDIFSDRVGRPQHDKAAPAAAPALFPHEPAPEPQASVAAPAPRKPVGGVSVFGAGAAPAADTIGAAVLQRAARRAPGAARAHAHTQKDIFDDLFAKSEQIHKRNAQQDVDQGGEVEVGARRKEDKVDLFGDDLFDDVDDIFTSGVGADVKVKMPGKCDEPPFDDDSDLFADIAVAKYVSKAEATPSRGAHMIGSNTSGSIFDSDDDLFSDKPLQTQDSKKDAAKISQVTKVADTPKDSEVTAEHGASRSSQISKEARSLFDDSDDDIFSNIKVRKPAQDTIKTEDNAKKYIEIKPSDVDGSVVSKRVIDDDAGLFRDDGVDLFLSKHSNRKIETNETPIETAKRMPLDQSNNIFTESEDKTLPISTRPNIFGDDEIDELFVSSTKNINQSTDHVRSDETLTNSKVNDELQQNIRRSAIEVDEGSKEVTNNDSIGSIIKESTRTSGADTGSYDNNIAPSDESQNDMFNDTSEDDIFTKLNRDKNKENLSINKLNMLEDESIFSNDTENNRDNVFIGHSETTTDKTYEEKISETIVTAVDKPVTQTTDTKSETEIEDIENNTPELTNVTESALPHLHVTATETRNDKDTGLDNMREVDANQNITDEPDVFADVFDDLPPEFQKPKEPKRSKNVNALFDDDSDDEALFFKKNDAALDERPDDFSSNTNADLFGVFHDEPPAIDVDFVHKPHAVDIFGHDRENDPIDIFKTPNKIYGFNEDAPEFFSNSSPDPISPHRNEVKLENEPLPELPRPKTESTDKPDGTNKTQNVETKKVGKLKAMSLNINVSTLLPGAAPARPSTTSNEELHTNSSDKKKETKSVLVKSASFDADPDASVLDNKLSKQRARIPVKRRPSSRRARRDAVRASAIDIGEDSTDNSSSIDDPPRHKVADKLTSRQVSTEVKENTIHKVIDDNTCPTLDAKDGGGAVEPLGINNEVREESDPDEAAVGTKHDETRNVASNTKVSPTSDVKSKVVYVLNDEDIFTSTTPGQVRPGGAGGSRGRRGDDHDDHDDIFKDMMRAPTIEKPEPSLDSAGISVLGGAYREPVGAERGDDGDDDIFKDIATVERSYKTKTRQQTQSNLDKKETIKDNVVNTASEPRAVATKKSIFDDLSDEENELFNTKKTGASKKSTIFESDSEEELFAGDGRGRGETRRVEVTRSLFGEEGEDDQLFGARPTKHTAVGGGVPRAAAAAAGAEPAFEDPLGAGGE